jgi:hypothetical protein
MKYRYVNTEYGSLRSHAIRSIMLWRCRSPEYCMNSTGSVLTTNSSADGAAPDGTAAVATAAITTRPRALQRLAGRHAAVRAGKGR